MPDPQGDRAASHQTRCLDFLGHTLVLTSRGRTAAAACPAPGGPQGGPRSPVRVLGCPRPCTTQTCLGPSWKG